MGWFGLSVFMYGVEVFVAIDRHELVCFGMVLEEVVVPERHC